ncbi:unnamed protein product [Hermetia illucens]|uniref:Uncharacterized protein n=2 Tax=Hermetia illucens TaxID=343691 RepID=A0A7R8V344_HERIL|nr:unnamed protein product [Hermetia illucens]
MKKALSRICNLMQQDGFSQFYRVPAANVIESINLSSQGDIRNAIINLHFASLKGAPSLETNNLVKSSKNQKQSSKRSSAKSLKSIGRDESITLMHALGRVFNPKYEEGSKPRKFLHIPEDLTDAFSSEPKMFVDFLHSNYLAHFSSIENALSAADSLSLGDILLAEYRDDSVGRLGLNVAIRGLMVSNEKPVSGWLPVKGLKRVENQRGKLEEELKKVGVKHELSANVLVSDYRTYVRIIKAEETN